MRHDRTKFALKICGGLFAVG